MIRLNIKTKNIDLKIEAFKRQMLFSIWILYKFVLLNLFFNDRLIFLNLITKDIYLKIEASNRQILFIIMILYKFILLHSLKTV
ncbi:hypothetical protein DU43_18365 [Methanosarcina mazei]|uniref:Transmembrane protein n=1 Tax=Methanosarcina mazei TaxID=2209 RepID=A0A0F8J2D6_METMZ|nr:hypothetical protein DU43_18365 [Methanosarcina mazei]